MPCCPRAGIATRRCITETSAVSSGSISASLGGPSAMPRIAPSNTGRTPMERLMGHAPHILGPWIKLEDAFFASKTFSPALLEQVRRTLALGTSCRYCQAKAGPPDRSHADSRTAAAVELAEHFARDHRSIDEGVLGRARNRFADAELCELIMFMGFMRAGGTFGAVLGLEPAYEKLGFTESEVAMERPG